MYITFISAMKRLLRASDFAGEHDPSLTMAFCVFAPRTHNRPALPVRTETLAGLDLIEQNHVPGSQIHPCRDRLIDLAAEGVSASKSGLNSGVGIVGQDSQGNPSDTPPDTGFTPAPALALNVILRAVTSRTLSQRQPAAARGSAFLAILEADVLAEYRYIQQCARGFPVNIPPSCL